jgi:GWxTD domain-containing protein
MFRNTLSLLAGLGWLIAPGPGAAAQSLPAGDSLPVEAVRFYRPGAGKTLVKAFVEVPYAQLANGAAPGDSLRYQITMRIADSTGLRLFEETWGKAVPSGVVAPGVTGMDITEFALDPGLYRMDVEVSNPANGRSLRRALELRGWPAQPVVSDLLLAPAMRIADSTDTVPRPGEIRQGSTMITAAAALRLTPLRSDAFYLLEAYNPGEQEAAGSMTVTIIDSTGRTLLQTPPATVRILPGGGVLKGQVPLAGLPSGDYEMRVDLAVNGSTTSLSEQFSMADLAETVARAAEQTQAASVTDEGYFAAMTEEQLDAAFEPLSYIATGRELRPYDDDLTPAGKRRFLTDFWRGRDPNTATEVNEARQQFYAALQFADREYGESGRAGRPGWKTDRGRIFAKYGAPDDVYQRQQEGRAPPYLVWRYSRGRGNYYIFVDRTGVGHYALVHTNDRSEVGIPSWMEIMTPDAVRDAGRYLGEDFLSTRDTRTEF